MDVKYLNDIPHYWPFMQFMGLPRFQYTTRELSTGAQFPTSADVETVHSTIEPEFFGIEKFRKSTTCHQAPE